MLEEGRGCLEIAQKAISSATKTLVHDHIDHCLENAVRDGSRNSEDTIRECKEITKYL